MELIKHPDSGPSAEVNRSVCTADPVRHCEALLQSLRALRESPGGVFEQVGRVVSLLGRGEITLDVAIQILHELQINPWSLLGGYGAWAEVHRHWAQQLGMPSHWITALGPRVRPKGHDVTYNPSEIAFRIPVDLDLKHIPADLKVKNLEVRHCPRLRELGLGLSVQENLSLHACGLLETLPADLEVGGRLCVTSCSSLHEIRLEASPMTVLLKDNFDLHALHLSPAFEGNLGVESYTRFEALSVPSGRLANLVFNCAGGPGSLPAVEIRGGLFLECQDFRSLPEGLQVGGTARICIYQSGSIVIPAGLSVGSDLLVDVPFADRVEIPSDIHVKGTLYLSEIPPWGRKLVAPNHLQVIACSDFPDLPVIDFWTME